MTRNFAQQLRDMAKNLEQENELSRADVEAIVLDIKDLAVDAVKQRRTFVEFRLDKFRLPSEPPLKKGPCIALEVALCELGLEVKYSTALTLDGRTIGAWGYLITWPAPREDD